MCRKLSQIGCPLVTMLLWSMVAYSQTGILRGRVLIKRDDGMKVAVETATVDAFRIDLPGHYTVTTDAEGTFTFAGLPYIGTYVLAASSLKARPSVVANAKAGRDQEYELVLESGNGQRMTADEALAAATALKATAAPNAETRNEILSRTFREGNQALFAKNYDEAIRLYDEGLAAFPQESAFLINKAAALKARGVERYNIAIASSRDEDTKQERITSARQDFREAVEAATRAVEIIKTQPVPEDESDQRRELTNKRTALRTRAEAMRLLVTIVDSSQAAAGLAAFQEYIDVEDDPYQRSKAELDAARMLLSSKNTSLAIEQFRRILIRDPNDLDALAGLGLALYQSGDKNGFLEAVGYLQRFIKEAPETHLMREPVMEVLKKLESVR
jgi:tetratricopeptide (TPR) repeat protein